MIIFRRLLVPLLFAALAGAIRADVTPAALFGDHAVLQRDKLVPVWGRADAGEKVTVTFGAQIRSAVAGSDGGWIVFLESLSAATQGADLTIAGRNTITLRDIVVGEVWLCSGQSNMEFAVSRAANAAQEIATANFPLLRHVRIEHAVAEAPADVTKTDGWKAATPENVGGFTAVGYFFARDIFQKLGLPVGLVHSSWGGTPVEAWMSPAAMAGNPAFRIAGERWQQTLAAYPQAKADCEAQTQTLSLPNTGQALAIDIGNPNDIHPTNKQDVGRRLALLAKKRIYGIVGDDTGPTFAGVGREGPALRVRFTHAGGGLIAHDTPVHSLEIAGPDQVFHRAEGKIERDTLLVSSPAVREPVAVRYAWQNAPEANLYNGAGLPAVPFRSDNW